MSIWYHCPSLQAPEMKPSSLDWSFSSHLFRSQLTILGRKPHNFYVVYVVNSETSEGIAKGTHDLLPSRSMVSTRSFRNPQKGQVMTEKPRFLSKTEAFKNPSTSRILHNWKNDDVVIFCGTSHHAARLTPNIPNSFLALDVASFMPIGI